MPKKESPKLRSWVCPTDLDLASNNYWKEKDLFLAAIFLLTHLYKTTSSANLDIASTIATAPMAISVFYESVKLYDEKILNHKTLGFACKYVLPLSFSYLVAPATVGYMAIAYIARHIVSLACYKWLARFNNAPVDEWTKIKFSGIIVLLSATNLFNPLFVQGWKVLILNYITMPDYSKFMPHTGSCSIEGEVFKKAAIISSLVFATLNNTYFSNMFAQSHIEDCDKERLNRFFKSDGEYLKDAGKKVVFFTVKSATELLCYTHGCSDFVTTLLGNITFSGASEISRYCSRKDEINKRYYGCRFLYSSAIGTFVEIFHHASVKEKDVYSFSFFEGVKNFLTESCNEFNGYWHNPTSGETLNPELTLT
jgi:hypothetical protein